MSGLNYPDHFYADSQKPTGAYDARKLREEPQGRVQILSLVESDLRRRVAKGASEYGEPLTTHNGRDALWDAYEEALDLSMYLRQAIEERPRQAVPPSCTCPSGDGSLRWPCPAHPPEYLARGEDSAKLRDETIAIAQSQDRDNDCLVSILAAWRAVRKQQDDVYARLVKLAERKPLPDQYDLRQGEAKPDAYRDALDSISAATHESPPKWSVEWADANNPLKHVAIRDHDERLNGAEDRL